MASGIKALSVAMYRQILTSNFPPQIHPIGWFMGGDAASTTSATNSANSSKQFSQSPFKHKPNRQPARVNARSFGNLLGSQPWWDAWIQRRFDQWRAVLGFERTNPLQLEGEELAARVALVYQQAGNKGVRKVKAKLAFSSWVEKMFVVFI